MTTALVPLPRLVLPTPFPFLAGTKLPSKNALAHSSFSRSSGRASNLRQMCAQVPSSSHAFSLRQQVAEELYSEARPPSGVRCAARKGCHLGSYDHRPSAALDLCGAVVEEVVGVAIAYRKALSLLRTLA